MSEAPDISDDIRRRLTVNYARFFGFECLSATPGAVTLFLDHRADFEHSPGWFEGAITSAIAQIAASYSAATARPEGFTHLVLNQSVQFVGAAQGERLIAEGRVVRSGKSVSFSGADVFVERDGERHLVARLEQTMRHAPQRG